MTDLADRMRDLAKTHQSREALVSNADALDAATKGYFGEPPTVTVRSFMGAYARAKRVWCECSGEPLVPEAVVQAGANLLRALRTLSPEAET